MDAYCVKCKCKREIHGGKTVRLKTGVHAMQGKCGECGTKITRITGK
jgi:hypothetical protein